MNHALLRTADATTMSLKSIYERSKRVATNYGRAMKPKPMLPDNKALAIERCETIDQAMREFINYCFQRTESGLLYNLLPDGQIQAGIWTPWGGSGKSELSRLQRDVLRRYLLGLKTNRPPHPLFYYLPESRRWYIDVVRFSSLEEGLGWWDRYRLTPDAWLSLSTELQRHRRYLKGKRKRATK